MKYTVLIAILTLSGCGVVPKALDKGAEANDAALETAERVVCEGASVGSIRRRYGTSEELAASWRGLCTNSAILIK